MIQTIDGILLAQMIIHGAAAIQTQKQLLNELNVFPVPDGDTGTNMCMTFQSAATELQKKPAQSVGEAAGLSASALLRGARGNSGVILSLLFRGFAKSLKEQETADGKRLAAALAEGVAAAYKAVMKPAEGTILTVSRLAAKRANDAANEQNSAEYVLEKAIEEGLVALANTVNQNPVLKKAGVVDAGGKGLLVIMQGMLDSMRGLPMPEAVEGESPTREKADFAGLSGEEIEFGYCTEFICSRDNKKDPEALRGFLSALGDSLVLVDDDEIIKVHVHTNHPGKALEEALTYGGLLTVKIENMREQHTGMVAAETEQARHIVPPEKKYGFVSVCAGDGLAAIFADLGCDGTISGGQTMNPSTEDILRAIDKTPAEIVYILPNNKNIIMAAQQCLALTEGKRAVVLPSRTVPEGIAAMLFFDPNADEATNTAAMTEALGKVFTSEVTYAARDSDFDGFKIKQGDYMALAGGKLFGTDKQLEHILNQLANAEPQQNAEFINIFYGADVSEADAKETKALFKTACPGAEITLLQGGQPVYYYMISAE